MHHRILITLGPVVTYINCSLLLTNNYIISLLHYQYYAKSLMFQSGMSNQKSFFAAEATPSNFCIPVFLGLRISRGPVLLKLAPSHETSLSGSQLLCIGHRNRPCTSS